MARSASWLRAMATALLLGTPYAATAQPATVSCAVEPALVSGTSLTLNAWAVNAAGRAAALPAGAQWRVDRGHVEAGRVNGGVAVIWTIPEKPLSGQIHASLVRPDGGVVCTATARRVPGIRGQAPANATARARHFLVREREAPGGYAALAYLLLPTPPAPAERERCLRMLAAWLRLLPPTAEMELYVERDQLTLFLLPLRELPVLKLDAGSAERHEPQAWRAAAQLLLAQYDHARAQALMAKMGLAGVGPGPLLVTRQTSSTDERSVLLVEDFASVDPAIVEPWLRWSLSLISQPRERSTEALQRVAMTLRNVIAHAARDLPDGGAAAREGVRVATLPGR
jgi:hypothetical protein